MAENDTQKAVAIAVEPPITLNLKVDHWWQYFPIFYGYLSHRMERLLPLLSIVFFIFGISFAKASSGFAAFVTNGFSKFVDMYGYVAPFAIYTILTPSLVKILESKNSNGRAFIVYAVRWLSLRRLFACLWAVTFTPSSRIIVLKYPL